MKSEDIESKITMSVIAEIGDWLLYAALIVLALALLPEATPLDHITYLLVGLVILVRIRILIRAIRIDALRQQLPAEEAGQKTTPGATPCPMCGAPMSIPADYRHNNVRCPKCAHVFPWKK